MKIWSWKLRPEASVICGSVHLQARPRSVATRPAVQMGIVGDCGKAGGGRSGLGDPGGLTKHLGITSQGWIPLRLPHRARGSPDRGLFPFLLGRSLALCRRWSSGGQAGQGLWPQDARLPGVMGGDGLASRGEA